MKNKSPSSNEASNQQRRDFIKTSTLLGAGVAVGAMSSTAAIADDAASSEPQAEQKGYQLSQHVLDYYKSADV